MQYLADRLHKIHEPQTIAMAKLSRELAAEGHDVISLTLGEPDFVTPRHIIDAAKQAMDDGFTFYTPVAGYPELRQAVCDKLKRENGLDYTPESIVVSTGAKHSIMNAVMALVNPGDEVIIPTPYWVSYSEMVKLMDGIPVFIKSTVRDNYKITAAQLEAAITPATKAIIFSSPCNPTGSVYSKAELKAFAGVFAKHPRVYIISDEIYEHINFAGGHESIAQFDEIKDRVIIVNGMSKGYAMTGWRIGYIAASTEVAKACEKIQGQYTSGTNSIAQKASIAALNGDTKPTHDMRQAYARRRELVINGLTQIKGLVCNMPEGAFYAFPDISAFLGKSFNGKKIATATDLCMYLLNEVHVSMVTGEAFGAPECVRISYATSDDKLVEALKRIKKGLEQLS
jgi:aspartate aminotransferase